MNKKMSVSEILQDVYVEPLEGADAGLEVGAVEFSSRGVEPGALFFCVPGTAADGHDYAADAVQRGAAALVVERPLALDVPQFLVYDARKALEEADEADKKDYEAQVEELERNLEDVKANEYMISEGSIRYYQEQIAPAMFVSRPNIFALSEDAAGELSTLIDRYLQGQIKAEQMIREMDSKVMMMQMENY